MNTSIFEPPKDFEGLSHGSMSTYSFMQVYLGYRDDNEALHFVTRALDFAVLHFQKTWRICEVKTQESILDYL